MLRSQFNGANRVSPRKRSSHIHKHPPTTLTYIHPTATVSFRAACYRPVCIPRSDCVEVVPALPERFTGLILRTRTMLFESESPRLSSLHPRAKFPIRTGYLVSPSAICVYTRKATVIDTAEYVGKGHVQSKIRRPRVLGRSGRVPHIYPAALSINIWLGFFPSTAPRRIIPPVLGHISPDRRVASAAREQVPLRVCGAPHGMPPGCHDKTCTHARRMGLSKQKARR